MVFDNITTTNISTMQKAILLANDYTMGGGGLFIWLVATMGVFILMSGKSFVEGFVAAGFVSLVIALFLVYLELLPFIFLFGSIVLFIVALLTAYLGKGGPLEG